MKVGYDPKTGFVGTKVAGAIQLECTNFDKLLIFYKNGTYTVINIPEKQYLEDAVWVGIADKKTVHTVVYTNTETDQAWAKRFIVGKFILDKIYNYLDSNAKLQYFSVETSPTIELHFTLKPRQKLKKLPVALKEIGIKGASVRGTRLSLQEVKKVTFEKERKYVSQDLFERPS